MNASIISSKLLKLHDEAVKALAMAWASLKRGFIMSTHKNVVMLNTNVIWAFGLLYESYSMTHIDFMI